LDQAEAKDTFFCPVCHREGGRNTTLLEPGEAMFLTQNLPGWRPEMGVCGDCSERFREASQFLHARFPLFGSAPILPIAARLGAFHAFSGQGLAVAFLDSGFFAHPDLTQPKDRIAAYVDVSRRGARRSDLEKPDPSAWHGMMTSVVACGNGRLSGGLYQGLASRARVVLVKCGTAQRITHDNIRRGLEWVVRHRKRYGIRVVNVSCGGDYEASYLEDGLSQAAEDATREGILVCAAVGNLGHVPGHPVLPPASAPSVLTVGGVDDKNQLSFAGYEMYHSSHGPTIDGLQKPEVLAPGIWVAAPLLPGSVEADRADLLTRLSVAPDQELSRIVEAHKGLEPALAGLLPGPLPRLREGVAVRLREENLVSGSYKHVDGTSFASPVVASVAAQMFEANPALTPQEAKLILIRTARSLGGVRFERQGWGIVDPKRAVLAALAHPPQKREGRSRRPSVQHMW
jgi:serine protease AprX